ncbi:Na+ dependent nucleoside transporter C-terminus-domain-containing protein [Flagelloscypha sp. PMI_526]|nr:Na+ dependent nucleoside transporter C-terminus-domain-containing protein [Flagelloscypha sp. PMI_526]
MATPSSPTTPQVTTPAAVEETSAVQRKASRSTESFTKEKDGHIDPEVALAKEVAHDEESIEAHRARKAARYSKLRPFILAGTALLILGWWISATVLPATRHRWIVQTLWAWFFILVIAFRYIPNRWVTKPVGAVWEPLISKPFFALPQAVRFGLGWLALLAIVFGSAFGFKLEDGSSYADRGICVAGLLLFQLGFAASSKHRKHIPWATVIPIAMFVLRSKAGFDIFTWIATLAADFLNQGVTGAAFFFDAEVISKHWFFVNTLGTIIFFIAFVQMMYYLGRWFFYKIMNVSGAEAVVAAASPFIGQGESACLVRPYADLMTESELHLTMTSGFSTIAGSVLGAYIAMGVPAKNLITASVMSIPASISISKMRSPETEEPVTRGRVVVDRGEEDEKHKPANAIHAFSKGAVFGLIVAGQILTNVLTVLALVATINGLLTWVGRGFGIHALTLQLVLGYIFYPVTFFLGVPRHEILRVSQIISTKLIANEFVAYQQLMAIMNGGSPLSQRAFNIASYALCGFANLGSLGIQIGVLGALAPNRAKIIARIAFSAMVCGFMSTLQTAAIAGMLL